jgi:hypothetical protein
VSETGSVLVGALGGARAAAVDPRGTIRPERVGWELSWWIGADDRWHLPEQEVAVRQSLQDGMPVVCSSMRVPGGDAVQTVYGGSPSSTVVEVTNESRAPFVATLVVRGAAHVALDGATIEIDDQAAVVGARPPQLWAVSTDGSTTRVVTTGGAQGGSFPARRDRGARLEAAFLYPLVRDARLRFALPASRAIAEAPQALPDAERVVRGWKAHLDRGMRVTLPERALQHRVDTARAQVLLAGQAWRPEAADVAALEDWGFDDEAAAAWRRLPGRARRRARRRDDAPVDWSIVRRRLSSPDAALLSAVRDALVRESERSIELLASLPADWRGLPLDVRAAPTRHGPVSYSARWHGDRVALLWDVPAGVTTRAPAFDETWSTNESRGETLLGPVR